MVFLLLAFAAKVGEAAGSDSTKHPEARERSWNWNPSIGECQCQEMQGLGADGVLLGALKEDDKRLSSGVLLKRLKDFRRFAHMFGRVSNKSPSMRLGRQRSPTAVLQVLT